MHSTGMDGSEASNILYLIYQTVQLKPLRFNGKISKILIKVWSWIGYFCVSNLFVRNMYNRLVITYTYMCMHDANVIFFGWTISKNSQGCNSISEVGSVHQ